MANYTVTFNDYQSPVSEVPSSITVPSGATVTIPDFIPEKENYAFVYWWQGNGWIPRYPNDEIVVNQNIHFIAVWRDDTAPTCKIGRLWDMSNCSRYSLHLSVFTTQITDVELHEGRTLDYVRLHVGDSVNYDEADADESLEIDLTPSNCGLGKQEVYVEIADTDGKKRRYYLGGVFIYPPRWKRTLSFSKSTYELPDISDDGYVNLTVEAYNYQTSSYDIIGGVYRIEVSDNDWSVDVIFDQDHVGLAPDQPTQPTKVKVSYSKSVSEEKDYRKAFFSTTRNANYSTGLANSVFVSGCEETNYTSRVWYSYVNEPKYFPDTNYVEVGSNDTAVMGLIKVGTYLGAIKQSKTTDTAIYLLYPTSFEDDTTYAIKQGVQGIGALSKFAFNILRDETLFLSPRGVMAIEVDEDESHKVKNRSFFVDGRLLKEQDIDKAFSFVYDGKYYLALPNGHCYVLDGNQRNSWGNDRTNLVYECYYLENIPARCFMKYNDELWFADTSMIYRMKSDSYTDAYEMGTDNVNVPVTARWATVFDDDGSVHYYKTMQKKGNVVSVLPNLPFRYELVTPTEAEFNKNKRKYFTNDGTDFVRCNSDSVYSDATNYYVRIRTGTKVYVRKDDKDPVEIKREFGEASDVPTEMFINKKFKKYKRLQFIIENSEDEPFGVDEIIKQYTIGNYAKK